MGLDQYLFVVDEFGESSEVAYWRKCNQIHGFFDRLCGGVENCERYYIDFSDLIRLRDLCEEVISHPNIAEKELPVMMGCFFGGYEYNNYYFDDLKNTVGKLNNVINNHCDGDEYYYYAWW